MYGNAQALPLPKVKICSLGFNAYLLTSMWGCSGFESGQTVGVARQVAFANYPDCWNGGGCITSRYNLCDPTVFREVLDKFTRHTGGSVLIFADGHAKWYKADQIKDKAGGGPINLCPPRY